MKRTNQKTEYITYRMEPHLKIALAKIASARKWSLSQLTGEIVQEWMEKNCPEWVRKEMNQ